jgi:hypothetical protein
MALKSCLPTFLSVSAARRTGEVGKEVPNMAINILPKKQQSKPVAAKKAKKAAKKAVKPTGC